ncbi:DUF348 domain-containing protein [Streptosporangiaceae bacterium NEAU-GS5]|nr:DUF348 domain-containing protein [Streptosporangiaceae bacterium NEAU-GS5]
MPGALGAPHIAGATGAAGIAGTAGALAAAPAAGAVPADADLDARRPRPMWRSPWAAVVYAAVAGVAVGIFGGMKLSKEISIEVDGHHSVLRSFNSNVSNLLSAAGITYGPKDSITPAIGSSVADNGIIVVRHARPITLIVDGKKEERWTTALSVGEALRQFRLTGHSVKVSLPAARPIPMSGLSLTIRTERTITLATARKRLKAKTTAETVRGVLAQAHIKLHKGDQVSPSLDTFPTDGTVIRIMRALPPHTIPISPSVAALNWAALADCESHGNPRSLNRNGPYYGLYQFSLSMWQNVGGTRTPIDWPAAEQTYRAQLLYQRVQGRWRGQWPSCGGRLFS